MKNKEAPVKEQEPKLIVVDVGQLVEDLKDILRKHEVPEEFYVHELIVALKEMSGNPGIKFNVKTIYSLQSS